MQQTTSFTTDHDGVTWSGEEAPGTTEMDHPLQRLRKVMERYPRLPATQKLVLVTLATFADQLGVAWPARKRLIQLTGLKERSIRMAVRALERASIVTTIMPRPGRAITYTRPGMDATCVPDSVCVYLVWPTVNRRLDPVARQLAMSWHHAQQRACTTE